MTPIFWVDHITASGAEAVILPRGNRTQPHTFDRYIPNSRNLVERFFARCENFRRFVMRYDKLDARYGAIIVIAAGWIWLA